MMLVMFVAVAMMIQAPADPAPDWRVQLEAGRQAYARQEYSEALSKLSAAAEAAAQTPGNESGMLESLRLLAAVHRETGDHAQAERVLRRAAEQCEALEPNSVKLAAVLEELAAVERAQGHPDQALATIERAVQIRESHPESSRVDLARALTAAAMLRYKASEVEKAIEGLQRAVKEWDAASPGDPQALPAIEALALVYRDRAQYAEAEPLFFRALRLREAASGPESSEVIADVDSLAYVEFGLKKFPEAEAFFKRLLDLWQKNAGPDHPMVALTFDKLGEFYGFQQRYEEAEDYATKALALRTKVHVASLNQTGRILLMEAKLPEAEDLYRRAVQIGDLAQAPDETLDPVLRIYAKILRELKRDDEADALDKRVKDALLRKADREGRRPSPVKLPY